MPPVMMILIVGMIQATRSSNDPSASCSMFEIVEPSGSANMRRMIGARRASTSRLAPIPIRSLAASPSKFVAPIAISANQRRSVSSSISAMPSTSARLRTLIGSKYSAIRSAWPRPSIRPRYSSTRGAISGTAFCSTRRGRSDGSSAWRSRFWRGPSINKMLPSPIVRSSGDGVTPAENVSASVAAVSTAAQVVTSQRPTAGIQATGACSRSQA